MNTTKKVSKTLTVILCILHLTGCSITALPGAVKDSIGQTESGIDSATSQIKNAKTTQKNNFVEHSNVGYFGNQAVSQNDTDFLPPVFSNDVQIDKQFFGVRSLASGITDLTKVPTILDVSSNEAGNDGCNDVRVTQQEGDLIDLLNFIGSRCDLGWTYSNGIRLTSSRHSTG